MSENRTILRQKQFRNQNPIFPVTVPDAFHPHGNPSCVLYINATKKVFSETTGVFGTRHRVRHSRQCGTTRN